MYTAGSETLFLPWDQNTKPYVLDHPEIKDYTKRKHATLSQDPRKQAVHEDFPSCRQDRFALLAVEGRLSVSFAVY